MQEKTLEKYTTSSDLGAFERIKADLNLLGYCTEKTKRQIIDEEKTHAAEILASVCYETDIPRRYKIKNNDLVDEYDVSLRSVLNKGIDVIEDGNDRKTGWKWELARRKIEKNNLESIICMPAGMACVEVSSTDLSKPKEELMNWGYSGDTLVRINYRTKDNYIIQRNIILKLSDINILNMLRKLIDKEATSINSSEELLGSPVYVSIDSNYFDSFIAKINNFTRSQESLTCPARYLANIVSKSKKSTSNSWEIVKSHAVFENMFDEILKMAKSGNISSKEINAIRAGVWQFLIDEASGLKSPNKQNSIQQGIYRARAIGAVFTSCGGTVTMESGTHHTESYLSRYEIAISLMDRIAKYGVCKACGVRTLMYGCGVYCRNCNQIWCREYLYSGKQLSHEEVFKKKYSYYWRI